MDAEGKYNHLVPTPTGDLVAVSKDCKNPEALLKIINEEYDIYRGIDAEGLAAVKPIFDQGFREKHYSLQVDSIWIIMMLFLSLENFVKVL